MNILSYSGNSRENMCASRVIPFYGYYLLIWASWRISGALIWRRIFGGLRVPWLQRTRRIYPWERRGRQWRLLGITLVNYWRSLLLFLWGIKRIITSCSNIALEIILINRSAFTHRDYLMSVIPAGLLGKHGWFTFFIHQSI